MKVVSVFPFGLFVSLVLHGSKYGSPLQIWFSIPNMAFFASAMPATSRFPPKTCLATAQIVTALFFHLFLEKWLQLTKKVSGFAEN